LTGDKGHEIVIIWCAAFKMARLLFYSALILLVIVSTVLTEDPDNKPVETNGSATDFNVAGFIKRNCQEGYTRVRGECKEIIGEEKNYLKFRSVYKSNVCRETGQEESMKKII
jgi:hypothetical protein